MMKLLQLVSPVARLLTTVASQSLQHDSQWVKYVGWSVNYVCITLLFELFCCVKLADCTANTVSKLLWCLTWKVHIQQVNCAKWNGNLLTWCCLNCCTLCSEMCWQVCTDLCSQSCSRMNCCDTWSSMRNLRMLSEMKPRMAGCGFG